MKANGILDIVDEVIAEDLEIIKEFIEEEIEPLVKYAQEKLNRDAEKSLGQEYEEVKRLEEEAK